MILVSFQFQDQRGVPLERWQMCSREEEPLILQQFLRFGETRSITQQLILQELTDKSNEEQRARAQSEIKKLIERNSQHAAAAALAAQTAAARAAAAGLVSPMNNGLHPPGMIKGERGDISPSRSQPRSSPMNERSITSPAASSNASATSSMAMVSPKNQRQTSSPVMSTPTTTSAMNGMPVTSSPMSIGSPLNRLQSMQPFDYRKSGSRTPEPRTNGGAAVPVPPTIPPMRMPPTSLGMGHLMSGANVPPSLAASYHNSITSLAKVRNPLILPMIQISF